VVLPKKTANDMVTAVVELRFGDGATLAGKSGAAQFAGSLINSGTRSKTRQQLADEMQKLNARIVVTGGGGGGFGGRGGGGRGDSRAAAESTAPTPVSRPRQATLWPRSGWPSKC